jgi:arsenite methyltransferase
VPKAEGQQLHEARMTDHKTPTTDEQMRHEFNQWAEAGKGEGMEQEHISITRQTLALMGLKPGQKVLDLGCGAGWASRLLAQKVGGGERPEPGSPTRPSSAGWGGGQVVGLDVSDEMIRHARASSTQYDNLMFILGSAQQIPWEENFFDRVLSVESFYYYGDQDGALDELFRVMAPQGELYILINLYRDNPYSLRWVDGLNVPVQVRSEVEYVELLRQHGYENPRAMRIPDLTPTPDVYTGRWFKDAAELRDFKRIGALLLIGRKPDVESPR